MNAAIKRVLLAICLASLAGACTAGEEAAPVALEELTPAPSSVEELGDNQIVLEYDDESAPTADESPLEEDGAPDGIQKKNCVYIQYCNDPTTHKIVCRSRTCGCSYQEASDECFEDARYVCGNTLHMSAYLCSNQG